MAAFIAKQVVGKQFDSVKGALGDKEDDKKADSGADEDPEITEAKREAEEKRNEKFRKQEEERERMRQDIRDKYGLRRKDLQSGGGGGGGGGGGADDDGNDEEADAGGRRKSKTPADGNGDQSDSVFPRSLSDLSSKVSNLPGKMAATVNDATDKCLLQ